MEIHSRRILISATLLSLLMGAYLFRISYWLLFLVTAWATCYDFIIIMLQTGENPSVNHIITLNLFLYAWTGGHLFIDGYYRNKNLWFAQVIVVSVSDILQYLIGKYCGKFHISPVSPNKTLEGYLGSLINVIIFYPFYPLSSIIRWTLSGIIGGVFLSWSKRRLGIKDTSTLLGPHGGWLDRVDGIYMSFIISALID